MIYNTTIIVGNNKKNVEGYKMLFFIYIFLRLWFDSSPVHLHGQEKTNWKNNKNSFSYYLYNVKYIMFGKFMNRWLTPEIGRADF